MGACSWCCFCIAKAEASPRTAHDGARVAESEMAGAEGPSASGRSDYYSARCEAMMRRRGEFSDDVAQEIEFSKSHWSEVSRLELVPESGEEEELNRENRFVLQRMKREHPGLFRDDVPPPVLGRMIAKGGQAEIYEVEDRPHLLLKVFARGTPLRKLQQSCPPSVLDGPSADVRKVVQYGRMLEDGRFAFLMDRCWGDLRKLIDQAMQEKNGGGDRGIWHPPFPYKGWMAYGWTFYPVDFMLGIAKHMRRLHEQRISHRDLKASNILLAGDSWADYHDLIYKSIYIADFECSIGVLGTGFWRAPEILGAPPEKLGTFTHEQWMEADVYSFGMTCFEIVTGRNPFDGELQNTSSNRQLVIEGHRPQLPRDLDGGVKDLITRCWESNPGLRPTFSEIVHMAEAISKRRCEFRLFRTSDELAQGYRLATVQEVNDNPLALMKVLREPNALGFVNLANGCVFEHDRGFKARLEKPGDAVYKLARFYH